MGRSDDSDSRAILCKVSSSSRSKLCKSQSDEDAREQEFLEGVWREFGTPDGVCDDDKQEKIVVTDDVSHEIDVFLLSKYDPILNPPPGRLPGEGPLPYDPATEPYYHDVNGILIGPIWPDYVAGHGKQAKQAGRKRRHGQAI